jgi:hypothetical protein
LIYEQFEDLLILYTKLGELFTSLLFVGGVIGLAGALIGLAIATIVAILAWKFVTANIKLLIALFLLYALLLAILIVALSTAPIPTNSTASP